VLASCSSDHDPALILGRRPGRHGGGKGLWQELPWQIRIIVIIDTEPLDQG